MNDDDVETTDEYKKEAAYLLKKIEEREEMVSLLKIAKPGKIADIQMVIARFDKSIARTERILELIKERYEQQAEYNLAVKETKTKAEKIKNEMIEHFAENDPEKLSEMLKMLGEDKSH